MKIICYLLINLFTFDNNLIILIKGVKNHSLGMIFALLGVGLLILGITGSSIWQEENISRMDLNKIAGKYTVPQIIINNQCIGGYDQLIQLHQSNKLKALLREYPLPIIILLTNNV